MRGVHLFAVLALAATARSQTVGDCATMFCEPGRTCKETNGKASCVCPLGYYGTNCGDSVCDKMKEAIRNLDLCSLLGATSATCVGDIAGGRLCQCPNTHSGVICENYGASQASLTDCQRQQRLFSYITYMLNSTDTSDATLNSLRSIFDIQKLRDLLRDSTGQMIPKRECTNEGFSSVQCEVSVDNLNSWQCYCADTRSGAILPGHSKSSTRPTDCSLSVQPKPAAVVTTGQFELFMGRRPALSDPSSAEYRDLVRNITNALTQQFSGMANLTKVEVTGVMFQASGLAVIGYKLFFTSKLTSTQQMSLLNFTNTVKTTGLVVGGVLYGSTVPVTYKYNNTVHIDMPWRNDLYYPASTYYINLKSAMDQTLNQAYSHLPNFKNVEVLGFWPGSVGVNYTVEFDVPISNIAVYLVSAMKRIENSSISINGTTYSFVNSDSRCFTNDQCYNGGTCFRFTCQCANGYSGVFCQNYTGAQGPCQNKTCYNGGSCIPMGNSSYCICPQNYTGHMCETWMPNQNNKTGMCPPTGTMIGMCVEACTSDTNCTGIMKCCSNGCGHTCQLPVYHHMTYRYNDTVRIDMPWRNDLYNPASSYYINLKSAMDQTLNRAYSYIPNFKNAEVLGFWPGSVGVNYTVEFDAPISNPSVYLAPAAKRIENSSISINGTTYSFVKSDLTGRCMNNSMCGSGYCLNNACVCYQGYWGEYCRNSSRPVYVMCDNCQNGGTCIFRSGRFSSCLCTRDFTGASCELMKNSSDPCQNMTCYNGGSCYPMGNSSFCMCQPGFTGFMCETRLPNINKTGMCPPRNNTNLGHCHDECTSDASCQGTAKCCSNGCGHSCQQPIYHYPCQNKTCYNGGSCIPMGNSSFCTCPQNYTGYMCETWMPNQNNPCQNKTCYNGGSCIPMGNSSFCTCPQNYTGYMCEIWMPNQNNKMGMCPPTGTMVGTCVEACTSDTNCTGMMKCCSNGCGHTCQLPVYHHNPCQNKTCYNGGSCIPMGNSSFCTCPQNYTGYMCETWMPNQNNKMGMCPPTGTMVGTCVEACTSDTNCTGMMKCCSNGCGHTCQLPVYHSNPCQNKTCYNGGSCIPMGNSSFCTCPQNYTGYMCETWMPNQNNKMGMCPPTGTMVGTCVEACTSDTNCTGMMKCCSNGCGHTCQLPVYHSNPCQNKTCYNGGSCIPMGNSSFCTCPQNYTGYMCETWMPNQNNKMGMCPPTGTMVGTCVEACTSDTNCTGIMKCCSNGCGHTCQIPIYHNMTYKFNNTVRIDMPWRNDLYYPASSYYINVKSAMDQILNQAYSYIPNFKNVEVLGFWPGSVGVNYTVEFDVPISDIGVSLVSAMKRIESSSISIDGTTYSFVKSGANGTVKACVSLLEFSNSTQVIINCLTSTMSLNATNMNSSDVCKLYAASVACVRKEFQKSYYNCSFMELSDQINSYFNLMRPHSNLTIPDYTQCPGPMGNFSMPRPLCEDPPLLALYAAQSTCFMQAAPLDPCLQLNLSVSCLHYIVKCPASRIYDAVMNGSMVIQQRTGLNFSKCQRPNEGGKACYSMLTMSEAMNEVITTCLKPLFMMDSSVTDVDKCSFYKSGLACARQTAHREGVRCSYGELHGMLTPYLTSSPNTARLSGCAVSASDNSTERTLCNNSYLLAVYAVSSSACMQSQLVTDQCSMLPSISSCLQMDMNCTPSAIEYALINNSAVVRRRFSYDFSSCSGQSAVTYKYNDTVRIDMPWRNDLYYPASSYYINLKSAMDQTLNQAYSYIPNFKNVEVLGFWPGSVGVNYTVEFDAPISNIAVYLVSAMKGIENSSISIDGTTYSFVKSEKPGVCPPVSSNSSFGICGPVCSSDRDCSGDSKCCHNGCGPTCVNPYNTPINTTCFTNDECYNGGTCFRFTCQCANGYSGVFCQNYTGAQGDCRSSNWTCYNGGSCLRGVDGRYFCACQNYYRGSNCEIFIQNTTDICNSSPCQNGGTCMGYGNYSYGCSCPPGSFGMNCEERLCDYFHSNVCMGASCIGNMKGGHICDCGSNRKGIFCESPGYEAIWGCELQERFSAYIQKVIVGAANPPLLNPAKATNLIDVLLKFNLTSYKKPKCNPNNTAQYISPMCEVDMLTGLTLCYCVDKYGYIRGNKTSQPLTAADCGVTINPCHSNPCQNNFSCINLGSGRHMCNCPSSYGPNCEDVPIYMCQCRPGEKCIKKERCDGFRCKETNMCVAYHYRSPCDSMPCSYNGQCVERAGQGFYCNCNEGYTGIHCQINSRVCSMFGGVNICGAGECVGNVQNGMLCKCPEGRRGAFCDLTGSARTQCERQQDLTDAVQRILNGTQTVPGVSNAVSLVGGIMRTALGSSYLPLTNCSINGDFAPQQCKRDIYTGAESCYCVNRYGQEIASNITVVPGQPPCTAPDPTDMSKLVCSTMTNICRNGGSCVGEIDRTPRLCLCPDGYEGILCEKRSGPGDEPQDYTMCTFSQESYNMMMAILNDNFTLTIANITINKNTLMSAFYRGAMSSFLPASNSLLDRSVVPININGTTRLAVIRPNCTLLGEFAPMQCEYFLDTGERHACYCYNQEGRAIPGTHTMAPDYPQCYGTQPDCENTTCPLECPHGLRKDMRGCFVCECRKPCDGVMCGKGRRCVGSGNRPGCRHTMKHGSCPMDTIPTMESLQQMFNDNMQNCDVTCHDDADCEGDKKCCGSCGNKCVTPYMPENCLKKKEVLLAHWNLYQNLSNFLQDRNLTSMANQSFPAMMHSAVAWIKNTTHMWKPSCNATGDYERVQCEYNLKTGLKDHCFCSNREGQRINGTDTRPPAMPICISKPGYCPTGIPLTTECRVTCSGDYDCDGHDKCCASGCSARCLRPVTDMASPHQVANVSALFRSICGRFADLNFCQSGSQCVGNWELGDLCACPEGYEGPFCDRMTPPGESAPSVCQKRHSLFRMIMDEEYAHLKRMFMTFVNMSSLAVMKANCSGREFNPVQCDHDVSDGSRKWCYCVNQSGRPIPGSGVLSPRWPRCGDMHCAAGHRLYNSSRPGHAMRCDPRSRPCPPGYGCKQVAYGQHVCCIDQYGHSDICRLTPNPGQWCDNTEGRWSNYYYFNSTLRKCMLFMYRGCHGNQNMFSTEAACNQRCARKEKPGMCPRMMEINLNQRFCKDQCMDDRNCTEDRKCCPTHCGRRCSLPMVTDNKKKCKVGVEYHHPNGSVVYCGRGQPRCPDGYECNVDPLDRPSFCCPKETEPLNICHEPKEKGPCEAYMPRYFFNRTSEQCERFIYGGCQGNNNNFYTLQECCSQCGTAKSHCKPGKCPKPQVNYFASCHNQCNSDAECLGKTRCCSNGCGRACLVPEINQTCHTKMKEAHMKLQAHKGGCPMISIPRCNGDGTWRPQQCLDSYGVCWCVDPRGNKIPGTFVRGHAKCSYIPEMVKQNSSQQNTSQPEREMDLPAICEDGTKAQCCNARLCHMHSCPAHPAAVCRINPCGGCRAVFYDEMNMEVNCNEGLSKCQMKRHQVKTELTQHKMNMMASMTDMLGNMTMNMTFGDEMMPGPVEEPESIPANCQLAPEIGNCRAYMPMWFFNHTSNRCEKFVYGGCRGNSNKFKTVEACYKECNEDANPCKIKKCNEQQKCSLAIDRGCKEGKCAHWAVCSYVFSQPHLTGVHLPTCKDEKFTAMQCQHGYCWCVNREGNAIEGSLAKTYGLICQDDGSFRILDGKAVTCSNGTNPNLRCLDTCMGKVCPGKPQAMCVVSLCSNSCSYKFMMGTEEVECGDDKCAVMYAEPKPSCQVEPACPRRLCPDVCATQSCGSDPCAMCRVDPCTCQAVFMDMMTNETITDCAAVSHSHCQMTWCSKKMERHREMLVTGATTISLPTCGTDGRYEPKQCQDDQCWCVDGVGQWLKTSDLYDVCGRNETVRVVIELKFDNDFSLVANKMEEFKSALIMSIIEGSGLADAANYIKEIQVYEGSIRAKMTLEDKEDMATPSTELPVLSDRIENMIKSGNMKVKFEDMELVADSGLYSRTDRFEGEPPVDISTTTTVPTTEPEPEAEPLEEKYIIIISVVAGVVGLIILSALVYCCCCKRKNKSETDSSSGSSDYSIEKKQDFQSPAMTNATYGMVYTGTENRSYKRDDDFIKVRL